MIFALEMADTTAALHAAVLSSLLPSVFAERSDCLSVIVPEPHPECIAALPVDPYLLPAPQVFSVPPEKCTVSQK